MNEVDELRVQLRNAMKARAMVYAAVYDELEAELGAAKAEEILKRAIYKRGLAIGQQFKRFGPRDIEGLREAFIAFVPDGGRVFQPEVKRCDAGGLDIKFHACPLKEAWLEAGMSEAKVAKLCQHRRRGGQRHVRGGRVRVSAPTRGAPATRAAASSTSGRAADACARSGLGQHLLDERRPVARANRRPASNKGAMGPPFRPPRNPPIQLGAGRARRASPSSSRRSAGSRR